MRCRRGSASSTRISASSCGTSDFTRFSASRKAWYSRTPAFEDFIRLNAVRGDYGPGDPEEQVQVIVARAREFLPHRFERQLTDGRTVLVEGFPFRSGGEISGFVTTYTDITDQKRTEEQLTRQRDVMKTIIDNFPGGISLCDTDLRFTAYNDQIQGVARFPQFPVCEGLGRFRRTCPL